MNPQDLRREGLRFLEAGHWPEAVDRLSRAVLALPHLPELEADLGIALSGVGRWREAVERWTRALDRGVRHADAVRLLRARGWRRLGLLEQARADLEVLAGVEAWVERGTVAFEEGEDPEPWWRRALEAHPGHREATLGLGNYLVSRGRPQEGALVLQQGLERLGGDHALRVALVDALSLLEEPRVEVGVLLDLLEDPGLDRQRLERAVCAHLPLDPVALSRHPLLVPWLGSALVRDPDLERALVALRRHLLESLERGAPVLGPLLEAMAIQAWAVEYAWDPGPGEEERARCLGPMARALYGPPEPTGAWEAVKAGRRPAGPFLALAVRCEVEPAVEAALAASLPSLGEVQDPTSRVVAGHYERFPYPRIVSVHRQPPSTLRDTVTSLFPSVRDGPEGPLRILVAGCGTGQESLSVACRYPDARVLAVDLSRASLGRAARLARQHHLHNIEFAQADLLSLGCLEQRFHLVECGGVLHHLADPLAGWRVLTGLLLPRAFMKIGLYAARGRSEIDAARALHVPGEPPRAFRRRILDLPPHHPARLLLASPDFYSVSGLLDLVFHPCEHRFSPLDLRTMMESLDLEFLGFQFPNPQVAVLFRERFPQAPLTDLALWDALEAEHPRIMSGMYQFWCRARDPSGSRPSG